MIQSLGRPQAPESPDTCHLDAKTLHRQVRTHAIGFVSRERSPITLLAMAANSAAVPEDRRGPITGLPSGVDYTCIKRFFFELPPWMTTLAWMAAPTAEDPAWRGFAGKTFRTVDRLLRRREAALAQRPPDEVAEARRTVTALRGQWIHQLLAELPRRTAGSLWVVTRLTRDPRPGRTTRAVTHVEAWTFERTRLRLLERRTIAPALKHGHGDRVDYFDLEAVHAALADLIRTYARDLLNQRCGTRWRSQRRPAGWPLVTRYAIPWLYDYLRPFYAVRGYRHGFKRPSAGHYPVKLRHDIRSVLRFERADLAGGLTLAHVTAAIQHHLRTAPPNRPMGERLCAELHGTRRRATA